MDNSSAPLVLIVEDDDPLRSLMQSALEMARLPVRAFASVESLLDGFDFVSPACLVLELCRPGQIDGPRILRRLRKTVDWLPTIFLTGFASIPMTVTAMRSGACNVLEKPVDPPLLVQCVHEALELATRVHQHRLMRSDFRSRVATLTPREQEVFLPLISGKTTIEISTLLGNSPHTVEKQRASILHKLHARSLVDLLHLHHAASAGLSLPGIACWPYDTGAEMDFPYRQGTDADQGHSPKQESTLRELSGDANSAQTDHS
jgi:FixJ family two-component response regulator